MLVVVVNSEVIVKVDTTLIVIFFSVDDVGGCGGSRLDG